MSYSLNLNSLPVAASVGLLFALPLGVAAQTAPASRATVSGTAVDGGAKAEPLPFATVLLRRAEAKGSGSALAPPSTAVPLTVARVAGAVWAATPKGSA
ncbi:MAG: hypothetical protein EOO62_10260, partial [Hymenobacter sp.]